MCNTVPLARALQRSFPQAKLTWLIGKVEHRLVGDLPDIEFIVVDKSAPLSGLPALRRVLAGRHFEVLLLAQVSQRAAIASSLLRADRRIGFDRARSKPGHGLMVRERIAAVPFQHQAKALLEFARHLGARTDEIDRRLPLPGSARDFARHHQPVAGQAVIISPASSHMGRIWSVGGYAAVADWVIEHSGREVFLMGGPSTRERDLGEAIVAAMRNRPVNLIGQDTLQQAVAMFERAACLISPDSGPAHFADAMGTPVVGLYAATWARRSGPLASLDHCVDRFPDAALRFTGKPPERLSWGRRLERPGVMELISPEMVIERLVPLLTER